MEGRGVADHGFIESIYLREPNGYVVELSVPTRDPGERDLDQAQQELDRSRSSLSVSLAMLRVLSAHPLASRTSWTSSSLFVNRF
tara:strand:+ start:6984 stop:7238 length:255 start_codon:yes stop_codon:yes gene_type:complete